MPVQILVKKIDHITPDGLDPVWTWKKGDPVIVFDENHVWGTKEDPSNPANSFWVITIENRNLVQVENFIANQDNDPDDEENPRKLRLYTFDYNSMPQEWKDDLDNTGRLSIRWQQIRSLIKNKRTGVSL